jgi:hypothetical protein
VACARRGAVRADDCSDVQADLLVANVGPAPTTVPATVELFDGRTGALLGSASVPAPLHSGEQVRVTLPVPAGPRPGGLRATVRSADDQCAETPDEATTNTLPCG